MGFGFLKGHGTGNDFVVLPDLDATVHGDLSPEAVRALCDRRRGIGADGVLRVLRGDVDGGASWFMDYRNADGTVAEMCGNGIRVFARYLADAGLVDPTAPLWVDTRDGIKDVRFCADDEITVDMGRPVVGSRVKVEVEGRSYEATAVDMGNPHAVVFLDSLAGVGDLSTPPAFDLADFPAGVNVELVAREGDESLSMRVFERGVGETQSCGTGACAAAVAAGLGSEEASRTTTTVVVPGGTLTVSTDARGHVWLKGPAVLVAQGTWRGDAGDTRDSGPE